MGSTPVDYAKIERLAELLHKHGLEEIRIEDGSGKISLKAPSHVVSPGMPSYAMPPPVYHQPHAGQFQAAATSAAGPAPAADAAPKAALKGKIIKSPFVGTFYRASSPGAEPLVSVGQRIRKGQSLCIVEAMKLMNEIEADMEGVVREILVENEQPVEFDQPLFVIE
jgi:acetyl-CoA carboxylase biotin carboxyl carrier protein